MGIEDWRSKWSDPAWRGLPRGLSWRTKEVPVNVTKVVDGKPTSKTEMVMIVDDLPVDIAKTIGYPVEVLSLAACIASEGYSGRDYALAMSLLGHVVMRVAKRRYPHASFPITTLLTASQFAPVRGHYGEQFGRWAATTRPPTKWHLGFALELMNGAIPDMSRGATKFLDLWGPGDTQRNRKLRPFPDVMRSWHKEVAWVYPIPGIETGALALFAPEPDPSKRLRAFDAILTVWKSIYGGGGREPPEGRSIGETEASSAVKSVVIAMAGTALSFAVMKLLSKKG